MYYPILKKDILFEIPTPNEFKKIDFTFVNEELKLCTCV